MNAEMHERITESALDCLSRHGNTFWQPWAKEMIAASNYPDIYYIGEQATSFDGWDADWRLLNQIPCPDGISRSVHSVVSASKIPQTYPYPMSILAERALTAFREENYALAAKLMGVFSHLFGDTAQQAHISDNEVIKKLYPQTTMRYAVHTFMERVSGPIPAWEKAPCVMASSVDMLTWVICERMVQYGLVNCGYIPPFMDAALHRRDEEAARYAGLCAQAASVLLADLLETIPAIANGKPCKMGSYSLTEMTPVKLVNVDETITDHEVCVNIIPGSLYDNPIKIDIGEGPVRGIAILPNMVPGFKGLREASAEYALPGCGLTRFTAKLGISRFLYPEQWSPYTKNETSAIFEVRLDGKTAYRSPVIAPDDPPLAIEVPIHDAHSITLYIRDSADSHPASTFFWPAFAEPTLLTD